ncbi:hypothetical protein MKW94_011110 [Papaver nudicaule]|uniref:Bms1-type G domain-containing protein n=1 Tax=Papaver nudicaule TaxID=74823 RepID=A0AA41VXV8_PAPNU|nr:hypothetical protein [Papaver nudicaule]
MSKFDLPALTIYTEDRLHDDELPLNKNTPGFDFPRPIDDPTPYVIVVQGPPNVGKSRLIRSLLRKFNWGLPFTGTDPITTISIKAGASGKNIQLQFVECPNDMNSMIDAAKYADVAILMVDASYGFEMETFEFRNLLQVHGFPKVVGVLTHLDKVVSDERSKVEKRLEDHFCSEIYDGAKLFSLSGPEDDFLYQMCEIDYLGEMLSDSQFLPLSWRAEHPYVLVDYFTVGTTKNVQGDTQLNRNLRLYGYLRGNDIKEGAKVHIAGAGDFSLAGVRRSSRSNIFLGEDVDLDFEQCHLNCKTGSYLRLDVVDVPLKIVKKIRNHPILVGGILPVEEKSGFMMVKIRRHSWHMDLLMSGVPITVSAGWRRYKTNAIYALENENGQHRLLTRAPEHKDCLAVIWGPLAPPKTRIVAVVDTLFLTKYMKAFRIMAKGVIRDFERCAHLLLKVKKTGTLVCTGTKTATIEFLPGYKFIRFIDPRTQTPIQTKSGILGEIDSIKELQAGGGIVECTFKDKIRTDETVLFPVLATLVLPSLFKQFKQLNCLFKPLKIIDDGRVVAITVAYDAAISAMHTAIAEADAIIADADEDGLAVSYQEVGRTWRMLDLRRGVVIHEGERGFHPFPNLLELIHQSLCKFASDMVDIMSIVQKRQANKRRRKCCIASRIEEDAPFSAQSYFSTDLCSDDDDEVCNE